MGNGEWKYSGLQRLLRDGKRYSTGSVSEREHRSKGLLIKAPAR